MPRTKDSVTVELPLVLRDRLVRLKVHERQACHEVIEEALDVFEDLAPRPGRTAQSLSGRGKSALP